MNQYVTILYAINDFGKYTSRRSEIISYVLIVICAILLLLLIIRQIKAHK